MSLRDLPDGELWIKTEEAARTEKAATVVLLEHLAEVQRRRLFALRGFGSLFEYVVRERGYSEAQASDRIGAMRLIEQITEVKEKIEAGTLSLTTAAQIQRFIRAEKKHAGREFSQTEKLSLVAQCEGQSRRSVEHILCEKSELPTSSVREVERAVTAQLTELKFTISTRVRELLEEIRSREGRDRSLGQIFEQALASHLEKLNRKTEKPRFEKPSKEVARSGESVRAAVSSDTVADENGSAPRTRYIRKAAGSPNSL